MAAAAGEGKDKGACELCGASARVYCAADEATLCWGCDARVHGANFLVARHERALLCRWCSRPTPWRAAGPRLGPTASLCNRCVRHGGGGAGVVGGDVDMAGEDEEEEDDDDNEVVVEEEDDEEGEGENQVVPWTEEAEATPPPVASSTSSSSREAAANRANAAECAKVPPLSPHSPRSSIWFRTHSAALNLAKLVSFFVKLGRFASRSQLLFQFVSKHLCRSQCFLSSFRRTFPARPQLSAVAGVTKPPPPGMVAGSLPLGTGRDHLRISSALDRRCLGVVRWRGIVPTRELVEMGEFPLPE
jgi:hypothetical protein